MLGGGGDARALVCGVASGEDWIASSSSGLTIDTDADGLVFYDARTRANAWRLLTIETKNFFIVWDRDFDFKTTVEGLL